MQRFLNQQGLGIIELLMATGMISFVMLGAATLLQSGFRQESSYMANAHRNSLHTEILYLLQDPENCLSSLSGLDVTTTAVIPTLKMALPAPTDVYVTGDTYGNMWTIARMTLSDFEGRAEGQLSGIQTRSGTAKLNIALNPTPLNPLRASANISYPLRVVINEATRKVQACYSDLEVSTLEFCNSLQGTLNAANQCTNITIPVYTRAPSIRIGGNGNIAGQLHVFGNSIFAGNTTVSGNLDVGSTASAQNITSESNINVSGTVSGDSLCFKSSLSAGGTLTPPLNGKFASCGGGQYMSGFNKGSFTAICSPRPWP